MFDLYGIGGYGRGVAARSGYQILISRPEIPRPGIPLRSIPGYPCLIPTGSAAMNGALQPVRDFKS